MDFDLTNEQKMIRDMAREFADKVIAPRAEEMEKTGEFPYDITAKMGELGMMGIPFPETYGGSGGDWVGLHLCIEELSRGDGTFGALLDVTTSVAGQEKVGAFALTEPDCGSDAAALKTSAVLRNGEWILNGTKTFISFIALNNASLVLVAARTNEDTISTFIVPRGSPGLEVGEKMDKIAMHAAYTSEVYFEDCRIPEENLLGDPTRGFAQHLAVLETGRISIAAIAVGMAQACLDQALRYAKKRIAFGQPIFNFEAIQFKLADMAVAIELARNQYLKAAWLKDQGRNHTLEATVGKIFASEMAEKVASDALHIHGGYGYMSEYPVSRYYRGAKLLQIVEGTSEVQRMVLGRILWKKG
jgi:alkylation response protein AidB-like acyl-CoA dehydrogenase